MLSILVYFKSLLSLACDHLDAITLAEFLFDGDCWRRTFVVVGELDLRGTFLVSDVDISEGLALVDDFRELLS